MAKEFHLSRRLLHRPGGQLEGPTANYAFRLEDAQTESIKTYQMHFNWGGA